jgi:hypothetical protein
LEGEGRRLSIVLDQNGDFSLHRTRDEPRFEVRFSQPAGRPLSLTVAGPDGQRIVRGDSFWHLYLAEPDWVGRHLTADLELLRPSWQLAATGWAIEEALVQRAQHPRPLDTKRWAGLVDRLASPEFAERQSAERELRRIGQVILPFLDALDRQNLDAEQASRIDALVDALSVNYEDNADRIATWLAADQQVWLSLLTRREAVKRRVAARQLKALVGHPIEFDPAAAPAIRKAQIERLKARYRSAPQNALQTVDDSSGSVPPPGVER